MTVNSRWHQASAAAVTIFSLGCADTAAMAPGLPARIIITPEASNLTFRGDRRTLEARVVDDDGRTVNGSLITWSSRAPAIVDVPSAASAEVVAISAGLANIIAQAGDLSATATVEVQYVQQLRAKMRGSGCMVLTIEVAYCWGQNGNGELGDGTTTDRRTPVRVGGPVDFMDVESGANYSCGLAATGEAYCWGVNGPQLGQGSLPPGNTLTPAPVMTTERFQVLEVGGFNTCGLTDSGDVWCWGTRSGGGLPVLIQGLPPVVQVTVGAASHFCVRTVDDDAYCWGVDSWGQVGVGAGPNPDGTLPLFSSPQLVEGGLTYIDISAGESHTCAVATGGSAYCWGGNRTFSVGQLLTGQLGDGSGVLLRTVPGPVASNQSFVDIDAGSFHTCARSSAGDIWCWGFAALGDGVRSSIENVRDVPVRVQSAVELERITAGNGTSCGITPGGEGLCWGSDQGWLDGSEPGIQRLVPTRVLLPERKP